MSAPGICLALQIAAVKAEAELAASYAAAPGVRDVPRLAGPAEARRDALLAALETLIAVERQNSPFAPSVVTFNTPRGSVLQPQTRSALIAMAEAALDHVEELVRG